MQFCVVVHTVERYRRAAEAAFQKVSIKMHSSSKNKDHTNFRYRPTSRLLLSTLIPKMWKLTSYVMFQTLDYTVCKNHQKCLIFIRLQYCCNMRLFERFSTTLSKVKAAFRFSCFSGTKRYFD